MSRRRPSFAAFVRRRWRALGLILVLLAGSLLVLVVTDRGHDPQWTARPGSGLTVDTALPSPQGDVVYELVREQGNISRLQARTGSSGALLWESPMNATRALLAASSEGVAVATDFPRAFLTIYGKDGAPQMQVALQGNPRALVAEGARVALALQAPGNPVFVYDHDALAQTWSQDTFVNSLDLRGERLAIGTGGGRVVVRGPDGSEVLNRSLPLSIRSLRLDADASRLVVGGYSLTPGNLSGAIAFLDVGDQTSTTRWLQTTPVGVGLVDTDDAGVLVAAVEESLPHTLRVFDADSGTLRWTRHLDGIVQHDDAGDHGGVAISPDGRVVAVATSRGPVRVSDAVSGRDRWSFDSQGSTAVDFARGVPDRFVADGRLTPNGPYDLTFLFSVTTEPFAGRIAEIAVLLTLGAVVAAAAVLAVGFWRLRMTY